MASEEQSKLQTSRHALFDFYKNFTEETTNIFMAKYQKEPDCDLLRRKAIHLTFEKFDINDCDVSTLMRNTLIPLEEKDPHMSLPAEKYVDYLSYMGGIVGVINNRLEPRDDGKFETSPIVFKKTKPDLHSIEPLFDL